MTFKDSYGKIVRDGDTILIEETYGRDRLHGKQFTVKWNAENGMYQWGAPGCVDDDFYSIHKFRKIKPNRPLHIQRTWYNPY